MGTFFHGGLAGKPRRGLICWGPMCGRFWDGCFSVQGTHLGTWGGGLSNGDCERRMKGALGMTRSLWRGSQCRVTREGISLHGAHLGNLEWAHLTGTLRGG